MADYDVPEATANGTQDGPGTRPNKPAGLRFCFCGCGETVAPKSTFRQGHDQKLVGKLARQTAEAAIDLVLRTRLGLDDAVNDLTFIDRVARVSDGISSKVSPPLANKFYAAAQRARKALAAPKAEKVQSPAAETASEIKSRQVEEIQQLLDNPPTVKDLIEQQKSDQEYAVVPGAPVKVKVGRWTYDATIHGMSQAGKVTAVRYYNKDDKEIVKTEGQFTVLSD